MKTLFALLMLATVAMAAPVGMGPCPQVTSEVIPEYIVSAIQDRLNDPGSMELVRWTMPVLETGTHQGVLSGWWYIRVTIRAKNAYGGVLTRDYDVTVVNESVTRCVPARR